MSNSDKKKTVDKLRDKSEGVRPAHKRPGTGMDGFSDSFGRGVDNGEPPTLKSKPSKPLRRDKPKSSNQ